MNKIRIFISSRVNSAFERLDKNFFLKDLRQYIREELEKETFLDENVLQVLINEESFNSDISKDAFDNCMEVLRSCNIVLILYNGEAGWAITDYSSNGICYEEFLIAMNEFSGMCYMLDVSRYFQLPAKGPEKTRNDEFAEHVRKAFPHGVEIIANSVEEMKNKILTQFKGCILASVEKSFETRKRIVASSSVFGETLDWSKLDYSERQAAMDSILKATFDNIPGLEKVIKAFHAIPDNMSVADARNMIGRPFIEEYKLIEGKNATYGIIHIVTVYGNATEIQVKNLVGYPDLAVIKGPFGYYLWEKHSQIQMIFLIKCINPPTIKSRFFELVNWLNRSGERLKIVHRAGARFLILKAIEEAQKTSGL